MRVNDPRITKEKVLEYLKTNILLDKKPTIDLIHAYISEFGMFRPLTLQQEIRECNSLSKLNQIYYFLKKFYE